MKTDTCMALQNEIIRTREKFERWLVTIPENQLQKPSKDPDRTNAELLYSISVSPLAVKSALKRSAGAGSPFLSRYLTSRSVILKTQDAYIRSHARDVTRWELAKEYEESCNRILALLDETSDADLEKHLVIPSDEPMLSGQFTVEELFHFVKNYFETCRKQLDVG